MNGIGKGAPKKVMIIEYTRYEIPAALTCEFLRAYINASEFLKGFPTCLGYELARCREEPKNFTLRIKWDSLEGHLEGFRKSDEFEGFYHLIGPFYGNIREMSHYDVTELVWESTRRIESF